MSGADEVVALHRRDGFECPADGGADGADGSLGVFARVVRTGSRHPHWPPSPARGLDQDLTRNTADSAVLDEVARHLAGKLYADKGYIGHELFKRLWRRGLHLITSIRRNMRNHLMPLADKLMLRKRFLIETVLDILKCEMGLEHSRHRSVMNAMVHVLSCLVAYAFRPGKPSISLTRQHIEAYP